MKICFVCSANICRSYVSETLLKHYVQLEKMDIEVISRGVYAQSCFKVPQKITDFLNSKKIQTEKHTATACQRLGRWS